MINIPQILKDRWFLGSYVGDSRPSATIRVRRGHLVRSYGTDKVWGATFVGDTDWISLPNIGSIQLDQTLEANGVTSGTVLVDNKAFVEHTGPGGDYHSSERGWFSPYRHYTAPGMPSLNLPGNAYAGMLTRGCQVEIHEGYGDSTQTVLTGLVDRVRVASKPDQLELTVRDFGQLLTDQECFGWNVDPALGVPLTFMSKAELAKLKKTDPKQAKTYAKSRAIVDDLSEMVVLALRWAGFPKGKYTVEKVGTDLAESITFNTTQPLMDIIRKACDLTGYVFFIGEPEASYPMGRPVFRRSAATVTGTAKSKPIIDCRDDRLLNGLEWVGDDANMPSIIRVRGKEAKRERGGLPLRSDPGVTKIMSVYRPPWHIDKSNAAVLRHVVHDEPLYKTQRQVEVAARYIALNAAMESAIATVQIPAYLGVQMDDIISVFEKSAGISTRCWIGEKHSTWTGGENASFVMSFVVGMLDVPDVVDVIKDLNRALNPNLHLETNTFQ